jgi:hypothetical protein
MIDQNQLDVAQLKNEMQQQQDSNRAAMSAIAQEEMEYYKNPEFLKQLQDPDVDTELWDWVEDEWGPAFSGAHILGQREESYEEQQSLLNRNAAERMIAERTPGRLLRENPRMLAISQGITGTDEHPDPTNHPAFREPLTTRKERVVRSSAEVMTNRQTLSIGGRGIDAVSSATVENRTVTKNEEEAKGATGRVKEVFR